MTTSTVTDINTGIDIRDILTTIQKYKRMIGIITIVATLIAVYYVWNSKSIYRGNVLIEIGYLVLNSESDNNKPTIIQLLDEPHDLKEAILQSLKTNGLDKENTLVIDTPTSSSKLIKISYEHVNRALIKQKLDDVVAFVLQYHGKKASFFQKTNAQIYPSAVIGSIYINTDPINPRKIETITIGVLGGLVFGTFMAFLLDFFKSRNKK